MKYYEFLEPYYALIKAENEDEATKKYIEVVAGDDSEFETLVEECNEVPEYYASFKFGQSKNEDEELIEWEKAKKYLESRNAELLLMDGSLI